MISYNKSAAIFSLTCMLLLSGFKPKEELTYRQEYSVTKEVSNPDVNELNKILKDKVDFKYSENCLTIRKITSDKITINEDVYSLINKVLNSGADLDVGSFIDELDLTKIDLSKIKRFTIASCDTSYNILPIADLKLNNLKIYLYDNYEDIKTIIENQDVNNFTLDITIGNYEDYEKKEETLEFCDYLSTKKININFAHILLFDLTEEEYQRICDINPDFLYTYEYLKDREYFRDLELNLKNKTSRYSMVLRSSYKDEYPAELGSIVIHGARNDFAYKLVSKKSLNITDNSNISSYHTLDASLDISVNSLSNTDFFSDMHNLKSATISFDDCTIEYKSRTDDLNDFIEEINYHLDNHITFTK